MKGIFLELRYLLTRAFLGLMGLRVGYWRRAVEKMWHAYERAGSLEAILANNAPRDAHQRSVDSLERLKAAPILTKEHFHGTDSNAPKSATFHRHTAGSSGQPTEVWLSRTELGRMLGVRDYCYRHCGIRVGDREARLWGRPESGIRNALKDFLLNRRVFHPAGRCLEEEVRRLVRWQPLYLYGYASLLTECANELRRTGRAIPGLRCVIVTAETIMPSQKQALSRIFECPVHEEYGASEFDIIGFECSDGHRHLVNPWLVVEMGPEGQALVTDVARQSQPVIRYELGDALALSVSGCSLLGDERVISELEGRTMNRFALMDDANRFHAVEFAHALDAYQKKYIDLFRFQVRQTDFAHFELICEPEPQEGIESVTSFVEDAILDRTGYSIQVRAGGVGSDAPGKHAYFVQMLRSENNQSQREVVTE